MVLFFLFVYLIFFQFFQRLPNWVESALKEAYATAESDDEDGDEDEDDDQETKNEKGGVNDDEDDEEGDGKKKKAGVLGSGALQARRALKNVFGTKAFRTAVSKTYERYATEGKGMEKKNLLEATRHFFYKRAPPDVRNVVPNPDDEMSTAAVVYLCLTYTLRDYRKSDILVKQAFTDCVKSTVEAALILRGEINH